MRCRTLTQACWSLRVCETADTWSESGANTPEPGNEVAEAGKKNRRRGTSDLFCGGYLRESRWRSGTRQRIDPPVRRVRRGRGQVSEFSRRENCQRSRLQKPWRPAFPSIEMEKKCLRGVSRGQPALGVDPCVAAGMRGQRHRIFFRALRSGSGRHAGFLCKPFQDRVRRHHVARDASKGGVKEKTCSAGDRRLGNGRGRARGAGDT